MNRIDVTQIVDPGIQQPLGGPSLNFLQDSTESLVSMVAQGVLGRGNSIGATVLTGCEKTGTVVANGYIFVGAVGKAFPVTGANTTGWSNPPMLILTTVNDAIDPVRFSDGITRSVHKKYSYVLTDTAASGILYSDLLFLQTVPVTATPLNSFGGTQKYYKDNTKNRVYLMGSATRTGQSASPIFTLPVGFRPTAQKTIPTQVWNGTTLQSSVVIIATNGDVSIDITNLTSNPTIYLDGIQFFTEW